MAKRKTKVPKKIAGVKLPKSLRRGLRELADSQSGRTVLLEALTAAGVALAAVQSRPGSAARKAAAEEGPKLKEKAQETRAAAVAALAEAARSFTDVLRRGQGAASADSAGASGVPH